MPNSFEADRINDEKLDYSIDEKRVLMHNPWQLNPWREIKVIRGTAITGSHRATSVRRFLLTSCAALVGAGIMLLGSPVGGAGPARAQFSFGGFHISIGPGHWRRGRHSYRSSRRHRRHREDDDSPDPDTGSGSSSSERAATTSSDSGRARSSDSGRARSSSAQSEPRPASSGRPEPRGPDLEPSK
jgi:hypothetical protein